MDAFLRGAQGIFPLASNKPTTIGRTEANDVSLPDPSVSARHALIYSNQGRFYARDLGSTNGTWVSGQRVGSDKVLTDGCAIRLGNVELIFKLPQAVGQPVGMQNARRRSQPLILLLAMLFLISGAVVSVLLYRAANQAWVIDDSIKVPLLVSALVALTSGYVLLRGFGNRCPSCRLWWQKEELRREVVDRRLSQRVVNLRTEYFRRNEFIPYGHSDREALRLVTIERHRCLNQCKSCGHQWITDEFVSE